MADGEKITGSSKKRGGGSTGKPNGRGRIRKFSALIGTAVLGIFVGRKVVAGRRGRGKSDGGGTAGVREPRRPLPTRPSGSGAVDPRAEEQAAVAGALS
jgi:hypothetical protein